MSGCCMDVRAARGAQGVAREAKDSGQRTENQLRLVEIGVARGNGGALQDMVRL